MQVVSAIVPPLVVAAAIIAAVVWLFRTQLTAKDEPDEEEDELDEAGETRCPPGEEGDGHR